MMKKAILFLLFSIISFAQVPQKMSHRGTAYNTSGTILQNTPIIITVNILNGNGGTSVFNETHNFTTNNNGQYNINIGEINPTVFSNIDWSSGEKWLKIEIAPVSNPTSLVTGSSQLMSVPYALYTENVNSNNSLKVLENINLLRNITGKINETIYIKGHTNPGDGGEGVFIWKIDSRINNDVRFSDNDGTIIQDLNSPTPTPTGRWIRLIDGRINIKYFGVLGYNPTDGYKIQKAIDFAALNAKNENINGGLYFLNLTQSGTVVYIPSGNYIIENTLLIKSGVSIEGENCMSTILTAGNTTLDGNMIEMDKGRIEGVNISNITFTGNTSPSSNVTKNCMHLKATFPTTGIQDGGIWFSTFKNIKINQFNGSGIILEGGGGADYQYNLPNQGIVFENINIERQTDSSNCLLIKGQQGQLTFIDCGFDGKVYDGNLGSTTFKTSKYYNVVIESNAHVQSAAIMFLTCTFQYSEYGIYLKFAENVTFDNCWFEILDRSIGIKQSSNTQTLLSSASINVLNSRFANASGFGSYYDNVSNRSTIAGVGTGSCIYVEESNVNIFNNFVTVTDTFDINNRFIMNYSTKSLINSGNNSFQNPNLGYTYGLANGIIDVVNNSISTFNNKFISVNASANIIKQINSNLEAGQSLTIKANGTSIKFDNTKNIKLIKPSPITLNHDEIATFIKVDGEYNNLSQNYKEYWVLVSITKVN